MDSIPLNFYQSASYSWHSNNDKNGVERFFRAVGAVFSGAIGQYKVTVSDATNYIDKFGGKSTWAGQALIKHVPIKERKAALVDGSGELPSVRRSQVREVPEKGASTPDPLPHSVSTALVDRSEKLPGVSQPQIRQMPVKGASTSAPSKVSMPAEKVQQQKVSVSPAASPVSETLVKRTPELVKPSGRNLASDRTSTGSVSANSRNTLNSMTRSLNDKPEAESVPRKVITIEASSIAANSAISTTGSESQYGVVDNSKPTQVASVTLQNYFSLDDSFTKNRQAFEEFSQTIVDENIVGLAKVRFPNLNVTDSEKLTFSRKNVFMCEIRLLMAVQSKKENLLKLMKDAHSYKANGDINAEKNAKVEFVKACIENHRARQSANFQNREYEKSKPANMAGSSALVTHGGFTPEHAFSILQEHRDAAYQRAKTLNQKYDEKDFAFELDKAIYEANGQYNQQGGARDIKEHTLQALEKLMKSGQIIELETGGLIIPGEVVKFSEKQNQYKEYAKKLHQHYHRISEYRQSCDPSNPKESDNIKDILQTILQIVEVQNYCRSQFRLDDSEGLQQLA
ncbi:hypothetical protein [Endozoicomonas ascidiicola]|uniref:hypothetical protein n=1 Tax=Endozoicomonas ascidiicola TaxID=1698521 RepID=UPI00082AD813|nr:hypothetical protein [Endozoicomonas ascidiicola]